MEAIRKITKIKNGSIYLRELEALNNQEVEVIVLSIAQPGEKTKSKKKKLIQLMGKIDSGYTDTSENVDKLIYGE